MYVSVCQSGGVGRGRGGRGPLSGEPDAVESWILGP